MTPADELNVFSEGRSEGSIEKNAPIEKDVSWPVQRGLLNKDITLYTKLANRLTEDLLYTEYYSVVILFAVEST